MSDELQEQQAELESGQRRLAEVLPEEVGAVLHHESPQVARVERAEAHFSCTTTMSGTRDHPSLTRQAVGEVLVLGQRVGPEVLVETDAGGHFAPDAHEASRHELDVAHSVPHHDVARVAVAREPACVLAASSDHEPA